jgi:hypothetical protein
MAIQPLNVRNEPDLTQLKVYTLASGTARTWTGNGTIGASGDDARSLSWTAGQRTLAFDWGGSGPHASSGVRLLDLAAGGTDLLADSRLAASLRPLTSAGTVAPPPATASTLPTVATLPTVPSTASALPFKGSALAPAGGQSSLTCQEDSIITPDGSAVVCGATRILPQTGSGAEPGMGIGTATVETGFIEYPTAAGRATRILGRWKIGNVAAAGVQVLWSDASGTILIGVIPGPGDPFGVRTGVIRGDEFSPLPQPAGASPGSGTW